MERPGAVGAAEGRRRRERQEETQEGDGDVGQDGVPRPEASDDPGQTRQPQVVLRGGALRLRVDTAPTLRVTRAQDRPGADECRRGPAQEGEEGGHRVLRTHRRESL